MFCCKHYTRVDDGLSQPKQPSWNNADLSLLYSFKFPADEIMATLDAQNPTVNVLQQLQLCN